MKNIASAILATILVWPSLSVAGPLCALASPHFNPMTDQKPSPKAMQQMGAVNHVLCSKHRCPGYRLLSNVQAGNAMAMMSWNSAEIRYNPIFMGDVVQKFGDLATIGILAHELGHLIDFANNPGQIPQAQREATADEYAGCAFALAGNPLNDLSALAATLHAMGASPGYPTPKQRVQLLEIGYNKCK